MHKPLITVLTNELDRLESKRYKMSMYMTQEDLENDRAINELRIVKIRQLLGLYNVLR